MILFCPPSELTEVEPWVHRKEQEEEKKKKKKEKKAPTMCLNG